MRWLSYVSNLQPSLRGSGATMRLPSMTDAYRAELSGDIGREWRDWQIAKTLLLEVTA